MRSRASLPFAIADWRRLNRDTGRIRRETERRLLRFLRACVDDAAKRGSDMLGVAAHRTVIEDEALTVELEGDAMKRHSPTKLLREQICDEGRREHGALVDLFRIGSRYDFGGLPLRCCRLVDRARFDDADRTAAAVANLVALFETDSLGDALERWVEDLDALLGQVELAQIAAAFRLRSRGPPAVA